MNIKEILNRMVDILKDKHTTWVYLELPKFNVEALRKRIVAILKDKHGGANMGLDKKSTAITNAEAHARTERARRKRSRRNGSRKLLYF